MKYEELVEDFQLEDICAEIGNELNEYFVDILGNDFEIGIFSEKISNKKDSFCVTVEIVCQDTMLNDEEIQQIASSVEEKLSHNLNGCWKDVQNIFDGVQIIINDKLISNNKAR